MENKKSGYLIVTLFGLLVLVLVGSDVWQNMKFRSIAVVADGTINGEKVRIGGKKTSYKYSVLYLSPEGNEDTAQVYSTSPFFKPGEKLQIFYDPATPKNARLDISITNSFLGILIGLLMLVWAFPNYLREAKNERARKRS
jgi:hypothetical protein